MYKIKNTELDFESRIFHLHKIFYSAKNYPLLVSLFRKKDIYLQRFFRKAPDIAEKTVAEMAQLVEQFIRNE